MKLNKKTIFIGIAALVVIAISITTLILTLGKDDKKPSNKKTEEEKLYTMYVKINPLVKLTFKETAFECENDNGEKEVCSGISSEIIDYELINNDAKEIYSKLDFKGKEVIDVLVELCDTARANDIGFESLEITSDWEEVYDEETIKNALKEKATYEYDIHIYVDFKEYIDEDKILEGEEPEEEKMYLVKFDSNGGSAIDNQVLKENEKVVKPENPTKDGYKFVEWQLNGKKYDFDKIVEKDITLKAKWEKIKEETNKEENKKEEVKVPEVPKEEPKEEEPVVETPTVTSTLDRINLNDNILVTEQYGGPLCGDYYFITNINSVYPSFNGYGYIDIYEYPDFLDRLNEFTFDTAKEETTKSALDAINPNSTIGIKDYGSSYENHGFSYYYRYLSIYNYESLGQFGRDYTNLQQNFRNNFDNIFEGAYFAGGGCGDFQEPILLTQELCADYGLTCDRW